MSELSINVPLSMLGDAKDLTPQAIRDALGANEKYREDAEREKANVELCKRFIKECANHLENVWENSKGPLERAQEVRQLIKEMKAFQ